jgi:exodeoxyribonuclease VII large subunit
MSSTVNELFLPTGVKVKTVAELTREIKALLEEGFAWVWVSGQISNYRPANSGHFYFTLKDSEAQLPAVMWRSTAQQLRFQPHDGLEIIAAGRVEVYPPHGKYQLVIAELQPKGLGALELAFRQLCEKLSKLGYFETGRKKPLPRFPRRIALITSPTGAAVRDMLENIGQRWPGIEILICPVRVQGDGAAQEIAAAIRLLNRLAMVDVMIVGRGGGSREDLWAFNEEIVAQAIFESKITIISAVGHEIDVTIADLVADCRASTPTHAACLVVPDREEILAGLRGIESRLGDRVTQHLTLARRRLDNLAGRRALRLPLEKIRSQEQRLDEWSERLARVACRRLERSRERWRALSARLEALSPLNVLSRGYSLTRRESDQTLIRSSEQVKPGERLDTLVEQGRIVSRVEELFPHSHAPRKGERGFETQ